MPAVIPFMGATRPPLYRAALSNIPFYSNKDNMHHSPPQAKKSQPNLALRCLAIICIKPARTRCEPPAPALGYANGACSRLRKIPFRRQFKNGTLSRARRIQACRKDECLPRPASACPHFCQPRSHSPNTQELHNVSTLFRLPVRSGHHDRHDIPVPLCG